MASSLSSMASISPSSSHLRHGKLTSFSTSTSTSFYLPTPSKTFYSSFSIKCTHKTPVSSHRRRRPDVVQILEERGLLESLTGDGLRSASSDPDLPPLGVYCGFDPTAETLHLGNLIGLVVMSWFLRCGHRAVALIGGATGRLGDPSGKSLERPKLDLATLDRNVSGISDLIGRIMGRNSETYCSESFAILNNYDWWKDVKVHHFLEEIGRLARAGTMMAKESVKKRFDSEEGISCTEFSYQLIQGSDFLHLFRNQGVNVQIGGSDQWGNITAGTDLIRKISSQEVDGGGRGAYGLTFPLLLKSDGTKFGKSEDGAIWLAPSMLSPTKFYHYFFSVPDADVIKFLKTLTFFSMEEIGDIERAMQTIGYTPNTAQRKLAEEVTRFVHGQEGLDEARSSID